jgi:hypothetical protein
MASRPRTVGGFLLQLIREGTDNGHFPTEEELFEKIRISRWWYRYGFYSEFRGLDGLGPILEELRDLGLIKQARLQEDTGFAQWEVGDSWKPPRHGDNDRPPVPPGGNAGGPEEGDGGGGMREVISHPLLFALDTDDFDELVDNLFPEDEKNDR